MGLARITEPALEPVDIDELRDHARVGTDNEIFSLRGFIKAAREWAEQYTERAFIHQRWRQTYDVKFPPIIRLMRGPLIIDTGSPASPVITYYDANGVLASYTAFVVDPDADPAVIRPGYDTVWPMTRTYLGTALTVTYDAGYALHAHDVPEPIRLAIKMLATYWFDQRTAVSAERLVDAPMAVKALLDPYRSRWMHAA